MRNQMSREDTFELSITFAGMCMLVDDTGPGRRGLVHVLLPPVGGSHPHEACLLYNHGHERQDGALLGTSESFDLSSRLIDLRGLATDDKLQPNMQAKGVVDLGRPISRGLLDTDRPGDPVLCRITLDAGTIESRHPGGRWRMGRGAPRPSARPMAIRVEWRFTVKGRHLDLTLAGLNEDAGMQQIHRSLYPIVQPIDGTDMPAICLWVYHTPHPEMPDHVPPGPYHPAEPDDNYEVTHFQFYYPLLVPPTAGPNPVYTPDDGPGTKGIAAMRFGEELTCIAATAKAEPV